MYPEQKKRVKRLVITAVVLAMAYVVFGAYMLSQNGALPSSISVSVDPRFIPKQKSHTYQIKQIKGKPVHVIHLYEKDQSYDIRVSMTLEYINNQPFRQGGAYHSYGSIARFEWQDHQLKPSDTYLNDDDFSIQALGKNHFRITCLMHVRGEFKHFETVELKVE